MAISFYFSNIGSMGTVSSRKFWGYWLSEVVKAEGYRLGVVDIIIGNDALLRPLHARYLGKTYSTDILTFDYSETKGLMEGELYISVPQVAINASIYGVSVWDELCRVFVHGLLHLCGYSDGDKISRSKMRVLEDHYLERRKMFHASVA